jgi:hypothetical protein
MKSVYVAASSDEQNRARAAIEQLNLAGIPCTSNWIENIALRSNGIANPRGTQPDLVVIRSEAVHGNKKAIREASILWLLVPERSPGRGGYYEAGYADALEKHLVFSGDTQQSVFCVSGAEFADDLEAFEFIKKLVNIP